MSQPQDPAFSLTTHLLSLDSHAFTLATQSPFLHHAGRGTLPKSTLQTWLAQDRLYAQAYIQFFSHLLSNIRLPAAVEKESRDERLVDILIESLVNVRRELKFFEDVAGRYGLELEVGEEGVGKGVLGYRALFEDVRKSVCATHHPHFLLQINQPSPSNHRIIKQASPFNIPEPFKWEKLIGFGHLGRGIQGGRERTRIANPKSHSPPLRHRTLLPPRLAIRQERALLLFLLHPFLTHKPLSRALPLDTQTRRP
jgi:hypothetical protein